MMGFVEIIKKIGKMLIPLLILVALLFISLIFVTTNQHGKRFLFLYPNLNTNQLFVEHHFVSNNEGDYLTPYVEALLLGSSDSNNKAFFPIESKVKSCFIRDNVAYIDLTKETMQGDLLVSNLLYGAEIFRKNIFRNFRNIKFINLYIEGNEVK